MENSLFHVKLPPKANNVLRQRRISRYIGQKTAWVEDGFDLVINQFMRGNGRVSDYLRISYPNDMPLDKRRNDTGSERKTLLFRFRYMLKCFLLISDDYMEFVQWRFSGLEFMMDIFCDVVRMSLGQRCADVFASFKERFRGIWAAVNPGIMGPDDFVAEVKKLLDEVDTVFLELYTECVRREVSSGQEARLADSMEKVADELSAAAREQHHASKILAKVAGVAASRPESPGDEYGRYAGLEVCNEAQRAELKAAIDMSHRDFPIARKPSREDNSLRKLASRCWKANADRFESLAKLGAEAGYPNKVAFAAALYRLAKRYPSADHFRWQS